VPRGTPLAPVTRASHPGNLARALGWDAIWRSQIFAVKKWESIWRRGHEGGGAVGA